MRVKKLDIDAVEGRLEAVRFSRQGITLELSQPYWLFWHVVPGMRRLSKTADGKKVHMPNTYRLDAVIKMLQAIPKANPHAHFDFDTTYTQMTATVQMRTRTGRGMQEKTRAPRGKPQVVARGDYRTSVTVFESVSTGWVLT